MEVAKNLEIVLCSQTDTWQHTQILARQESIVKLYKISDADDYDRGWANAEVKEANLAKVKEANYCQQKL